MIVRIFDTAVHPEDVERARQLFREQVQGAFEAFEGCEGIEMLVGVEEHSRELVEVVAISRWNSITDIENALSSPEYENALADLRKLFQQAPLVRHFERLD